MIEDYWKEEANSLEIQCTELKKKIEELEAEKKELVVTLAMILKTIDLIDLGVKGVEKIEKLIERTSGKSVEEVLADD